MDAQLLEALDRFGRRERRSRSQVIELAVERFLETEGVVGDEIVTSPGRFQGAFSREETYDR